MAVYNWKCECGEITDCERAMEDIDTPPETCKACSRSNQFIQRVILPPTSDVKGFILNGRGWHSTDYTKYRSIT